MSGRSILTLWTVCEVICFSWLLGVLLVDFCDGLRLPLNLIEPMLRLVFRYRDIQREGRLYLRRWYLSPRTRPSWWPDGWKWYRLFLHHILRSDEDPESHDHPWSFTSCILGGSYREQIDHPRTSPGSFRQTHRIASVGSVLRNQAEHTHKVEIIRPVWSLVISPEATREWGFWAIDPLSAGPDRWVQWDEYLGIKGEALAEEDRMRSDKRRPMTQGQIHRLFAEGRLTPAQAADETLRTRAAGASAPTSAPTSSHDTIEAAVHAALDRRE